MAAEDKRKYMVDTSDADRQFVLVFMEDVKMLAGIVREMVEEDSRLLLSPVMRQLLIDKAKDVQQRWSAISPYPLFVDNPGADLTPNCRR